MKRYLIDIGLAALKGSVELLMILPLLLLIGVYLFPPEASLLLWLITLPLFYMAGFTAYRYAPISRWYRLLLVVLLLGAAGSYGISGMSAAFFPIVTIAGICVYRGARMEHEPWERMFPVSFYAVGLIVYFIASVILQFVPSFDAYMSFLTWFGLLALAITLLATNQFTMKLETLSGDKEAFIARGVLWQNRILVAIAFVIIIMIVFFRKLQAALGWLKELIFSWLSALFNQSSVQTPTEPEKAAPPPSLGLEGNGPPALWLQWLEKVMMFVVGAALVIGLLVILYLVAKRIPKVVNQLYTWLRAILGQKSQRQKAVGYVDDIESLMDWKAFNSDMTARFKHWIEERFTQRAQWNSMDNQERIRYLYKQWIRRNVRSGYQPQKHLTPQETSRDMKQKDKLHSVAPEAFIRVYEQVRYGDKLPEDRSVTDVKKIIEGKDDK
jgi:hypothetical protein